MGADPIRLVSYTGRLGHRLTEGRPCEDTEMTAKYKSRKEALGETNPGTCWHYTPSLHTCENVSFCWRSHPLWAVLLWPPEQMVPTSGTKYCLLLLGYQWQIAEPWPKEPLHQPFSDRKALQDVLTMIVSHPLSLPLALSTVYQNQIVNTWSRLLCPKSGAL